MAEDHIMEHTSDAGNPNNGEDEYDLNPCLGRGITASGGKEDRDDTRASSDASSSRLSVHT